jgi:predicted ribosome quality control (RQC) complex YloA/Tae2 family protein
LHREGETLSIPLDPSRTPGDNLDRLYKKAKKIHRAAKVASERLGETQRELEAGPPPQLAELAQGPGRGRQSSASARPGGGGKAAGKAGETLPYRRYRSSDGWLLLVGRNSVENDRLVREAKGWDLWLHARDGAGAHVIVKKPGKDTKVLQRTLAEAAGLAALHSKRSDETAVEVMYVEAERVKKPKGASPGRVLVSGEQTLRIAPGAGNPKEV